MKTLTYMDIKQCLIVDEVYCSNLETYIKDLKSELYKFMSLDYIIKDINEQFALMFIEEMDSYPIESLDDKQIY